MQMLDFVPVVALLALTYSGINWLKELTNKQWNAVVTQISTWVAGIVFVWLFSESDFGGGIAIGDTGYTLGSINTASLVLVGLSVGALATLAYDLKSAIDKTDTAKTPTLMPSANNQDGPEA